MKETRQTLSSHYFIPFTIPAPCHFRLSNDGNVPKVSFWSVFDTRFIDPCLQSVFYQSVLAKMLELTFCVALLSCLFRCISVPSGVVHWLKSCMFPTGEMWVLKMSILLLNSPKMWDFQSQILHFRQEEHFPTGLDLGEGFKGSCPLLACYNVTACGWLLKFRADKM